MRAVLGDAWMDAMADAITDGDRPGSLSLRFLGPRSSFSSSRLADQPTAPPPCSGGWCEATARCWCEEECVMASPLDPLAGCAVSASVSRSTCVCRPGEEDEDSDECDTSPDLGEYDDSAADDDCSPPGSTRGC